MPPDIKSRLEAKAIWDNAVAAWRAQPGGAYQRYMVEFVLDEIAKALAERDRELTAVRKMRSFLIGRINELAKDELAEQEISDASRSVLGTDGDTEPSGGV